jgi:lipoprotein-releasing system ATP-binding protein
MNKIITAKGLAKTYGKGPTAVEVLKDVDLAVNAAEKVAIVGSSGSGKSTLLHLLGGLDTPSAGEVNLVGENINQLSTEKLDRLRNRSLGFIYQFHHLLDEFTALENVALPLRIRGLSKEESRTLTSSWFKSPRASYPR